jgi:chemotaxis response regulator CheB
MTATVTLEARREALKKAIQSGVLRVQHGDTSTQYRSLEDMLKALAMIEAELADAAGTTRRGPKYVYQPTKGL